MNKPGRPVSHGFIITAWTTLEAKALFSAPNKYPLRFSHGHVYIFREVSTTTQESKKRFDNLANMPIRLFFETEHWVNQF